MQANEEIKRRLEKLIHDAQALYALVERSGAPMFPADAAQNLAKRICLECGKPITAAQQSKAKRGVHEHCYQQQRRAIRDGKYTDADLVASGKLAPPRKPGRPRNKTALEREGGTS